MPAHNSDLSVAAQWQHVSQRPRPCHECRVGNCLVARLHKIQDTLSVPVARLHLTVSHPVP